VETPNQVVATNVVVLAEDAVEITVMKVARDVVKAAAVQDVAVIIAAVEEEMVN
jgi:hypothetical protein